MTISHNTVYFVVGTRVTIARSHGDLRGEPDGCLECVDEGRDDDMVRHQYRSPSDGWVRNEAEEDDDRLTEERIWEALGSTRAYLNGKKSRTPYRICKDWNCLTQVRRQQIAITSPVHHSEGPSVYRRCSEQSYFG